MSKMLIYNNFIKETADMSEETNTPKFKKGDKKYLKMFISKDFENVLKSIIKTGDYQTKAVSNRILNIDKLDDEENKFEFSYIDIDREKEDMVTFIPAQRAWMKFNFKDQSDANIRQPDESSIWKMPGRQQLSIGKFLNKVFDNFSEIAIDKFVNSYKAEIAAMTIYDRFKLVSGEDIRHWYAESNYETGSGQLNSSCMRYDGRGGGNNCQKFLDIYCNNPEKCTMLILTNKNNKLIGRALAWKNLRMPEDRIFMDRIYTIKQSDVDLFKKYAIQNNWIYKSEQTAYDDSIIIDGNKVKKTISLVLKPKSYNYYPYMDTLKYYNPTTGRLASNPGRKVEGTIRIKLESAGGSYNRID